MTVYVLWLSRGDYDSVHSVWTTKEKAESELRYVRSRISKDIFIDDVYVEAKELDTRW